MEKGDPFPKSVANTCRILAGWKKCTGTEKKQVHWG